MAAAHKIEQDCFRAFREFSEWGTDKAARVSEWYAAEAAILPYLIETLGPPVTDAAFGPLAPLACAPGVFSYSAAPSSILTDWRKVVSKRGLIRTNFPPGASGDDLFRRYLADAPEARLPKLQSTLSQLSPETDRAYSSDISKFLQWGARNGINCDKATGEEVAAWLKAAHESGLSNASVTRAYFAIKRGYERIGRSGKRNPSLARVAIDAKKAITTAPHSPRVTETISPDMVRAMLSHCSDTLSGKRDRALLALGFSAGLSGAELAALSVEDIKTAEGCISVTASAGTAKERVIGIADGHGINPADALAEWVTSARITEGQVFRSINRSGLIGPKLTAEHMRSAVKGYASRAGYDAANITASSLGKWQRAAYSAAR